MDVPGLRSKVQDAWAMDWTVRMDIGCIGVSLGIVPWSPLLAVLVLWSLLLLDLCYLGLSAVLAEAHIMENEMPTVGACNSLNCTSQMKVRFGPGEKALLGTLGAATISTPGPTCPVQFYRSLVP